jgi:hypothetical protein
MDNVKSDNRHTIFIARTSRCKVVVRLMPQTALPGYPTLFALHHDDREN